MLILVNLFEFEIVIPPELGVASTHRVGGFQQIVTEETVAGLNKACVLGLKFTGPASRRGQRIWRQKPGIGNGSHRRSQR